MGARDHPCLELGEIVEDSAAAAGAPHREGESDPAPSLLTAGRSYLEVRRAGT